MINTEFRERQDEWVQSLIAEIEDRGGAIDHKETTHRTELSVQISFTVPIREFRNDE